MSDGRIGGYEIAGKLIRRRQTKMRRIVACAIVLLMVSARQVPTSASGFAFGRDTQVTTLTAPSVAGDVDNHDLTLFTRDWCTMNCRSKANLDQWRIIDFRDSAILSSNRMTDIRDLANMNPPRGMVAMPYDSQVSLNWDDNVEPKIGYNIYRALIPGGPYNKIATEHANSYYTDFGLTNGITYYYVVTAVDLSGIDSEDSNEVSATPEVTVNISGGDLDYGAYYGYQAWHLAPDPASGSVFNQWIHWFDDNTPTAAKIHGDLWPDMREYPDEDLFNTQMAYPNGDPVKVYSCSRYSTIDLHVKWMKDYGLRGHFFQAQCANITNPDILGRTDTIARYIRTACEKYEVKFCMMPCNNAKSASQNENIVSKIINYWKHCVDDLRITESPQYIHQNGLPVIGFWGLGFDNRPMTVAEATEILDFFQNSPEHKYRVYVMGGVPVSWRTAPKAGWSPVFLRLDMISPWRTVFNFTANSLNRMNQDLIYCNQNGLDYNPVVSPGASTAHMRGDPSMRNWKPRNGGQFFWDQVHAVCQMDSKFMYVAMFDEVDEGTAMYKMVNATENCPVGADQVPLNEDGYNLPSDWYLRVGAEAQKMLDGTIPLTSTMPIDPENPFLPIAHWRLDESQGNIANDDAGDKNGILHGDPTWHDIGGWVAGALELDGAGDYVATDFILDPAEGPFSVFAYIKGGAPGQVIVSQMNGAGNGWSWLAVDVEGNLMTDIRALAPRGFGLPLVSDFIITDGDWHHIAFVWDGSYRHLFVDGEDVAMDAWDQSALTSSDGGLYFGADNTLSATGFFNGMIDDVRIYNETVTP
jgi:hypothetical protein